MLLFVMNKTRKNKYIIIIYRHVHTDYLNILILLTEIGIRGGLAVLSVECMYELQDQSQHRPSTNMTFLSYMYLLNILSYH